MIPFEYTWVTVPSLPIVMFESEAGAEPSMVLFETVKLLSSWVEALMSIETALPFGMVTATGLPVL